MRESHLCLFDQINGWIAPIAMLVAAMLVVAACSSGADTIKFPNGRFVHEQFDSQIFEFNEDGTWRYFDGNLEEPSIQGKYDFYGKLYTKLTHDYAPSLKIYTRYTWTYDGQKLTFHLWGEDVIDHRKGIYDGQTYIKVE